MVSIDFSVPDDADMQDEGDFGMKMFKVVTTGRIIKYAKVVVLAIRASRHPIMPRKLSAAEKEGA